MFGDIDIKKKERVLKHNKEFKRLHSDLQNLKRSKKIQYGKLGTSTFMFVRDAAMPRMSSGGHTHAVNGAKADCEFDWSKLSPTNMQNDGGYYDRTSGWNKWLFTMFGLYIWNLAGRRTSGKSSIKFKICHESCCGFWHDTYDSSLITTRYSSDGIAPVHYFTHFECCVNPDDADSPFSGCGAC